MISPSVSRPRFLPRRCTRRRDLRLRAGSTCGDRTSRSMASLQGARDVVHWSKAARQWHTLNSAASAWSKPWRKRKRARLAFRGPLAAWRPAPMRRPSASSPPLPLPRGRQTVQQRRRQGHRRASQRQSSPRMGRRPQERRQVDHRHRHRHRHRRRHRQRPLLGHRRDSIVRQRLRGRQTGTSTERRRGAERRRKGRSGSGKLKTIRPNDRR